MDAGVGMEDTSNMSKTKTLISAGILLVTATAGAIWHFAPMDLALANQEKIAMMDAKDRLEVWEDRLYELEDRCVDKRTDEWLCSISQRAKHSHIKREIKLLEKELGIEEKEEL